MKKVQIKITNAYGIGSFNHEFDFDFSTARGSGHQKPEHSQTNIIYARNGTMKTSLAKALDSFAKGAPISDPIHNRVASVELIADGTPIDREGVFVVKSEEEYFESDNMSLLLADSASQERYAEIMTELDAAESELFETSGHTIGIYAASRKSIERFEADFEVDDNRLALLLSIKTEVDAAREEYRGFDYKILTDKKVTDFLDKSATQTMLRSYVDSYEKILESSEYFQEGAFDYLNAFAVQKSLDTNNFMRHGVENSVVLRKKDGTTEEVKSIDDLKEKYESDKNRIFETLEKQEEYQKFDNAMDKNENLRGLQKWVRGNKELVPYLQNYKNTRRQIWYRSFLEHKESYDNFVNVYEAHRDELESLIKASRNLATEWKKVVEDFKASFRPPFDMVIKNQEDVVLKQERPIIVIKYIDDRGGTEREIAADILYQHVLSKGERRALYILCIMFELHMRKLRGDESLVIFDDIADSFDYRNKYSIIEYLHSISFNCSNKIHMILLTHNYDFFRAFRMRCSIHWSTSTKALEAHRNRGVITLRGGVYTKEFERIKDLSRTDINAALTLIPLVRNIVEYRGDASFDTLTNILHVKSASADVTMTDVCDIIESNVSALDLSMHKDISSAQQKILDTAENIIQNVNDSMEHKVVLSMATRIMTETYIKARFISDGKTLDEDSYQTGKWTEAFCVEYPRESDKQRILRSVNIVTPELLHVNAFMYEPIIDMSIQEIAETYSAVKGL